MARNIGGKPGRRNHGKRAFLKKEVNTGIRCFRQAKAMWEVQVRLAVADN